MNKRKRALMAAVVTAIRDAQGKWSIVIGRALLVPFGVAGNPDAGESWEIVCVRCGVAQSREGGSQFPCRRLLPLVRS